MTDTVDSTAVEVGTDIAPVEPADATLWHTTDPVEVVERATRAADALKRVLVKQGLTSNIKGRTHVRVEGWTTLGSMLGVVPVVVWTKPIEKGWEARVEARTLDGRVVGAAEASCTRDESTWRGRDDYALRSMAQTRGTSKALRGPLGFIVTLAGYDPTPEEEMPQASTAPAAPVVSPDPIVNSTHIDPARVSELYDALAARRPTTSVLNGWLNDATGTTVPASALVKSEVLHTLSCLSPVQADKLDVLIGDNA